MLLHALMVALATTAAPDVPDAGPHPLERVAVIGASVTWGYGTNMPFRTPRYTHRELVTFPDVLEATLVDDYELAHHESDIFFFQRPMRTGPALVSNATIVEPTALIAVDFLFWFGYGEYDMEGRLHADGDSRLAMLEQGLELLSTFECPIIVSDFPNMRPAIGRILKPTHVPAPETLDALNTRLHQWADEREHVHIIPLADLVSRIQQGSGFDVEELNYTDADASTMLQPDALHPTVDGDIVIAQLVLRALDAASDHIDVDDYTRDPDVVRQRLIKLLQKRLDPALQAQPVPTD